MAVSESVLSGEMVIAVDKVREDMSKKRDLIWPEQEFLRIAQRVQKYSQYFCSTNFSRDDMVVEMGGIVISIEGTRKSYFQKLAKMEDSIKADVAMVREANKLLKSLEWYQAIYKKGFTK